MWILNNIIQIKSLQVTINQALKEKNLLAGKLATLKSRLVQHNRYVRGETPAYNTVDILEKFRNTLKELVDLKTRISKATQPQVGLIIHMAEVKSLIAILKMLPNKVGKEVDRYSSGEGTIYDATISEVETDALIEDLEASLRTSQDALDRFNATTEI